MGRTLCRVMASGEWRMEKPSILLNHRKRRRTSKKCINKNPRKKREEQRREEKENMPKWGKGEGWRGPAAGGGALKWAQDELVKICRTGRLLLLLLLRLRWARRTHVKFPFTSCSFFVLSLSLSLFILFHFPSLSSVAATKRHFGLIQCSTKYLPTS